MQEIKEVKFSCKRDDLVIRGLECLPANMPAETNPLPAVIISHGFMANHTSVLHYAKLFAQWGYAAFCFDFCGGCIKGESDGKTTDMSVLTEVQDLKAVLSYVQKLPSIDRNHLLLMGCSQGGFVSAMVASQLPQQIAGLILFYPAFCIPDDARSGNMMCNSFDPDHIPEVLDKGPMKLGRTYPASVQQMDAYAETKNYHGPLLIVHGTADEIVHLPYIEKAWEMYTDGKPEEHPDKQLLLIEGAPHAFTGEADQTAITALSHFVTDLPAYLSNRFQDQTSR